MDVVSISEDMRYKCCQYYRGRAILMRSVFQRTCDINAVIISEDIRYKCVEYFRAYAI